MVVASLVCCSCHHTHLSYSLASSFHLTYPLFSQKMINRIIFILHRKLYKVEIRKVLGHGLIIYTTYILHR